MKMKMLLVASSATVLMGCGGDFQHVDLAERLLENMDSVHTDSVPFLVPTVVDSMKFVFDELHTDYLRFIQDNQDFVVDTTANPTFSYMDSLGNRVNLQVFDFADLATISLASHSYLVARERDAYVVRTFDIKQGYKDDSLYVYKPEELRLALLPFRARIKEARGVIAKMRMERRKKLERMVKSTS